MPENFEPSPNWENFLKAILSRLDIPTRTDIQLLHNRLDRLEQLLHQKPSEKKAASKKKKSGKKSASTIVLEVVANHPKGTNFKTIKAATGFDDKKIRNILFRLDKLNRIERVKRGIYKIS